jgi:hypothetical protein
MGSILDARRAGKYPASPAANAKITTIRANVSGSPGVTPNNMPLAKIHDATMPTITPMAASPRVCSKMLRSSISAEAPSAIRIPISCVHRLRNQRVNSQRGQRQRKPGKSAQQNHHKSAWRDGAIHHRLHRPQILRREVGLDGTQRFLHRDDNSAADIDVRTTRSTDP